MRTEYQAAIAQLTHEKGLPQDVVTEAVANALLAAYRKSVGGGENVRIEVERSGEVRVWVAKRVVTQVRNSAEEISLGEAQQIDPHAALGQHMEVDSPQIFDRIPAQTAKQIILQRIREAEQDYLFESFKDRLEDLVMGTVVRRDE
ncbi:MAG: transcription termination/antitermination protein NusA, partial [Chloroflexi bacterium]